VRHIDSVQAPWEGTSSGLRSDLGSASCRFRTTTRDKTTTTASTSSAGSATEAGGSLGVAGVTKTAIMAEAEDFARIMAEVG